MLSQTFRTLIHSRMRVGMAAYAPRYPKQCTVLFEPLLMVFIGLVIGLIVVLMYLPIFELAGSIQ